MAKIKYILLAILLPLVANATLILDPPVTNIINITNDVTVGSTTVTNLLSNTISNSINNVVTNNISVTNIIGNTVVEVTNLFNPTFSPTNNFSPVNNISNAITVGSTTVNNTNLFTTIISNTVEVAGVVVTNNINVGNTIITNVYESGAFSNTFINNFEGTFTQTIISNDISQFTGVNVFTPIEVETNATDTLTISLTTNYAVGLYYQTGNITSVVFSVDSTNDVALGEVLLQATTNTISWPTNGLTWAAGSAPTLSTGQWSILYFRAWRDDVHAVYVGDSP